MLFYQMSRMCKEKGAIRHDDRLDCLAQAVSYFQDAMAISAQQQINLKRHEEWMDLQEAWFDDPEQAANHMALGLNLDQRREARNKSGSKGVFTWT